MTLSSGIRNAKPRRPLMVAYLDRDSSIACQDWGTSKQINSWLKAKENYASSHSYLALLCRNSYRAGYKHLTLEEVQSHSLSVYHFFSLIPPTFRDSTSASVRDSGEGVTNNTQSLSIVVASAAIGRCVPAPG